MRTHSAEALILRTHRYGEANRIVVFLTEDRGKRRGVALNASASRRRFGAALEPLTLGRVSYVERESRELVRLDRVEPRQTPLGHRSGSTADDAAHRLGLAAYFAELLDEWAPDGAPNERLYRLGAGVSAALASADCGSVDALARYFEYWLLRLEGVYPELATCPRCGGRLPERGAVLVLSDHALVCLVCAPGGLRLSPAALTFLGRTTRLAPVDAANAGTSPGVLREIEQVHARLMATHLERELRSARVVKELRPDP